MTTQRISQGLLSMVLAAALFLFSMPSVRAAELPGETTAPAQTTAATETTLPPETTAPVAAEETESTETTEATEPAVTAPEPQSRTLTTIAQAWAMPAGTEDITIRGTVVFADKTQAILQDSTGGMRMAFPAPPELTLGDVIQATGMRSGGFAVTSFEKLGTAELPAVAATLLEAGENLRVRIESATLSGDLLQQNGFSLTLIATLPEGVTDGSTVDAYGVILDGRFYADTVIPREAPAPPEDAAPQEWNLYFGQLHAHTSLSDGLGTVEEAFHHAKTVAGLDFFAVTDHSNSFDNAAFGAIGTDGTSVSNEWAQGKAAAAAATDETFVGMFGYEMTWPEDLALGHINTFSTPGWQTRDQLGFETLTAYYEALTTVPGAISQFNHPGPFYGDFQTFGNYSPAYDAVIHLLEVGSEGQSAYEWYTKALDAGWHVAPTNNQNNHNGSWGDAGSVRTVVLAKELTEESLYDAIRNYRVYATEDSDLSILYRMNGHIMGSILGPTGTTTVAVELDDPTDAAIGTVEVVADGGETLTSQTVTESSCSLTMTVPGGCRYYYLRITQPDGDIAVTAPVWVDNYEDMGIRSFVSDVEQPQQGQAVTLSLELYNDENADFVLEKLEFSKDGQLLHEIAAPGTVYALNCLTYTFPFAWSGPGEIQILAKAYGTVEGQTRIYETLLPLRYQAAQITVSTMADARKGTVGEAYRVKGHLTAGNDNPHTTFSNTLYLQDDTGGMEVTGFAAENLQIGRPMEVTGVLRQRQNGSLYLELTDFTLPQENYYRHVPRSMTNAVAMDYAAHGGELLQVEGEVVSLTLTADGLGVSRFTLKDVRGDLATVLVEENIRSAAYGTNTLTSQVQKGRTTRAMGLLHVDEYGQTVLRVRNCDEVVYVPAVLDPTNPKTGDLSVSRK